MKINKKGFTLVELLVVIIILLAIMLVALPNISNTLDKSKKRDNTRAKELITQGALLYANDMDKFGVDIPLSDIVSAGYLTKKEAKNCPSNSTVNCTTSSCELNNCD